MSPCLALIRQSIIELASSRYSPTQIQAWVDQYPSPEIFGSWRNRRVMLVAREQNTLVGFGQIEIERQEIVGFHVAPSQIRQGIGSELVAVLETIGFEAGIREMVVQASLNAVAFYQSCGYTVLREIEFKFRNGVKSDAQYMLKQLVANSS